MNLEDFSAVENAYQPSGRGSWAAYGRMLITGGGVAVGCGALFVFFKWFITRLFANWLATDPVPMWCMLFYVVILGAYLTGYLIGKSVGAAAIARKNRNRRAAQVIGFWAGGVGWATYLYVSNAMHLQEPVLLISGLEALGLIWAATKESGHAIAARPFCEVDQEFMLKKALCQYPFDEAHRVRELLWARQFTSLRAQAPEAPLASDHRVEISFWYCPRCQQKGFINGYLHQTRYTPGIDGGDSHTSTRLIYSEALTPAEITALVSPSA